MFNLLAVIISVALTTVMGAAGVFYAGSAFTSAGPKAAALGVIQSLSQVDAAWTLYTSNGLTTSATVPTMTGAATGTDLIDGGYLAAVPTAPSNADTFGATGTATYQLDLVTAGADTAQTGVFIVLDSNSVSQCTEIARGGGQVLAAGDLVAPGTGLTLTGIVDRAGFTAAFNAVKFGCIALGNNPSGLSIAGVSFVAGDGTATPKYVAYFKR